MTLSLDIILYQLKILDPVCIFTSALAQPLKGARQFFLPNNNANCTHYFASEYLYIAPLSDFKKEQKHLTPDMTCLAVKDCDDVPESFPCTLVLIERDYPIPMLLNRCFTIFEYYSNWDKEMHIASLENRTMQELVDLSEEVLSYPTIIFDTSFDVLAYTRNVGLNYESFRTTISQGYTDAQTMRRIKEQQIFSKLEQNPVLVAPAAVDPDSTMLYIRFEGNQNTLGFAAIYLGCEQPHKGYLDIAALFADNLSLSFRRDFEQNHYSRMLYENFLSNLLHTDNMSDTQLENQLEHIEQLNRYGTYILGVLSFDSSTKVPRAFIARTIAREFHDVHVFLEEENVCMIRDYPATGTTIMTPGEVENISNLLSNYQFTFGLSNMFNDIRDVKHAYRQSLFAIRMGIKNRKTISIYSDYIYEDLFEQMQEQLPLELLKSVDYQNLQSYDRKNNTNYCNILHMYLVCDCNATHAAERLYLHRNTIRKAVLFAEEQLHIDLSDPNVKKQLMLSYLIDDFLA